MGLVLTFSFPLLLLSEYLVESQVWYYTLVTQVCGRPRQEDHECEASLGYTARPRVKTNTEVWQGGSVGKGTLAAKSDGVSSIRPTWQKEGSDSCKVSSDCQRNTTVCMSPNKSIKISVIERYK